MFDPHYLISNQILSGLAEIAQTHALVRRCKLLPKREVFLRRAALIKMAHTSTSIEGNNLAEYQVARIAGGQKTNGEASQVREIKNYLAALREVDKLAEGKKDFGLREILKLHKMVVTGLVDTPKAGVFRMTPVYVVNELPGGYDELVYTPPESKNVARLITELLRFIHENKDVHPIIKAGLFHYQFETIHPFTDGNGRTGRLLTLLYLYQAGFDFKKVLVLEDYYNRDRKAYYEALQTGKTYKARQRADLTSWLAYFVDGFLDEAQRVHDSILSLSVVKNTKSGESSLDKDELKIVDFAITLGKITSADVCDILNVPKRTAQAKLKRLEDMKVLTKAAAGPATYYGISIGRRE